MSRTSALLVVVVITAVAGIHKVENGYVMDDDALILHTNDGIHNPHNIPALFFHDNLFVVRGDRAAAEDAVQNYRPIFIATYFWDAYIGGKRPLSYHLTNLVIHLACVALVFWLALALLPPGRRSYAPLAALWFGIHPVLTEAHVWISGRSDILAAFFGLLALNLWVRVVPQAPQRRGARLALHIGAAASLFLGLLCKETLAMALLPMLVWAWWLPGRAANGNESAWQRLRGAVICGSGLLVAVGFYVAIRMAVLHGARAGDAPQLLTAAGRAAWILWEGIHQLLVPSRTASRVLFYEGEMMWSGWFVVAWTAALVAVGAVLRYRRHQPLLAWSLLWYAVTLTPAAVIATLAWPGFGRYLYIPFCVLCIPLVDVAVQVVRRLGRAARACTVLCAALYAGLLIVMHYNTVNDYRDLEHFHRAVLREWPHASFSYYYLGSRELQRGKYAAAARYSEMAVRIKPNSRKYWLQLATARLRAGDRTGAAEAAREGMQNTGPAAALYHVRARATWDRDPRRTARYLLDGLLVDPGYAPCRRSIRYLTTAHPRAGAFRRELARLLLKPRYAPLRR